MDPDDPQPNDQFVEGVENQQAGQEPATKVAAPDPNAEMRAAIAELGGQVGQFIEAAKPRQQEAVLTDEQKAELWAIYDPEKTNKDFMRKFFRMNPDATPEEVAEAKGMFRDMQQGLVRQAIVGSRNLYQQELAKLREEYAPLKTYVEQQRAVQTKDRFYSEFEALKDPRYEKVVAASARMLSSQTFASEKEYFKALAESAADAIKGLVPDFDLGAKPQQTQSRNANTPRLPRTSAGGTGGSGGGGQAKAAATSDDDAGSLSW